MSLINKMLQDLDARGTPAAPGQPAADIKPVIHERRAAAPAVLAAGVGAALALAGLAWFGWQYAHRPVASKPAVLAKPAAAPVGAPVAAALPPSGMSGTVTTAPSAPAVDAAAPVAAEPVVRASAQAPVLAEAEAPVVAPVVAPAARKRAPQALETLTPLARDAAPLEPDGEEARSLRRSLSATLAERQGRSGAKRERQADKAPARPKAKVKEESVVAGRQENTGQRAEASYRRALASMQEGRMGETVAALEDALRIEPGHEAARQTLVALLIEGGRGDEAMRQLQLGLARDAKQPALAMLLARLQIERGGNGIDTLTRTLPFAGNNPDYHAFLAGALARQQRHREAAAEYLVAVRGAPANGVWWMGLGMSLQAEKRDGEALDAFRKARAGGTLTPELLGFVERRIQQLAR